MINNKGMTLIEILIAFSILAFLSIFTAQSITSSLSSKRKHSADIEYQSMVRDALKVIEKDVNRAFHYKNVHIELYNAAKQAQIEEKNKSKQSTTGVAKNPSDTTPPPPDDPNVAQPTTPAVPQETFTPKKQRLYTHFIGDEKAMNFATLNNTQSQEDEKSSDQMEVGYYIQPCKSLEDKSVSSDCLWRRTSSILDDNVEEGGNSFVLIEGIEEFKIQYFSDKKQEWQKNWDSKENIDNQIKDHFPAAIEVKLSVANPNANKDKKTKSYSYTLVAQVRFRNNPEDKKKTGASTDEKQ